MKVSGLFGIGEHLKVLSETGDPLETLAKIIDFEAFRPVLDAGLGYSDGAKGGRPPYDPVTMFKVLILAAQHNVSDERMEFLIRDRLSWLRFLGFGLGDRTPDENTIRLFREQLTRSGTIEKLIEEFDRQLKASGYLAMGGQIVDASLIAAPRRRNTASEKAQIKAGRKAREIWKDEPNKAAQKDTDARWTVKIGRPRDPDAERSVPELAIAVFGYKTHVAIDRAFGFIRSWAVTSGSSGCCSKAWSPRPRWSTLRRSLARATRRRRLRAREKLLVSIFRARSSNNRPALIPAGYLEKPLEIDASA